MNKNIWYESQECAEALAYYCEGHTQREVAEKYGLTIGQASYIIQKRRAKNGRGFQEAGRAAAEENNQRRKEVAEQKVIVRLNELGFDYLGGWEHKNSKLTIRCRKCGFVFERIHITVRKGKCECPGCRQKQSECERQAKKQEAESKKIEQRKQREAERMMKNPNGFSLYQLKREALLDVPHICEVCGTTYTARDRINNENLKYSIDTGCCSNVCAKKRSRRRQRENGFPKNHLQRARRYGCVYDSSVTLKKLIERDGLRCAICGELCDKNDDKWSQYFGPSSPTIDHIRPLSKGGSHTWDNVQVAHALCNSIKRDSFDEEMINAS